MNVIDTLFYVMISLHAAYGGYAFAPEWKLVTGFVIGILTMAAFVELNHEAETYRTLLEAFSEVDE